MKEDWWSVILGLWIVGVAYALFASGGSLYWAAAAPEPWSSLTDLWAQFDQDWSRYLFQFLAMLGMFTLAAGAMGHDVTAFVAGFLLVYVLSLAALVIGAWDFAQS